MPNQKISELNPAVNVQGEDLFALVNNGETRRMTLGDLNHYIQANAEWQNSVLSIENDPSTLTPAQGDRYLIGETPVGVWAGKENQIAFYEDTAYQYVLPTNGMKVVVDNDDASGTQFIVYHYEGDHPTGSWHRIPTLFESMYNANTLLKADVDNTPIAMTINEGTLVGRTTGGTIAALGPVDIVNIIQTALDDNYIPLSGTIPSAPLTGTIEFDSTGTNIFFKEKVSAAQLRVDDRGVIQLDNESSKRGLYIGRANDTGESDEDSVYIHHTDRLISVELNSFNGEQEHFISVSQIGPSPAYGFTWESHDNTSTLVYSDNDPHLALFLSSQNSMFNAGVINSVVLGGNNLVADQNNTAFAQELRFNSSLNSPSSTAIVTDAGSTASIHIVPASGNSMYISSDGTVDYTFGYAEVADTGASIGFDWTYLFAGQDEMSLFISRGVSGLGVKNIEIYDNETGPRPSTTDNKLATFIASSASTFNQNVFNSVVLGGQGLTADQNNTAFAQELRFDSNVHTAVVSDRNSGVLVQINDFGNNEFIVTTDNALYDESYIYLDSDIAQIGHQTEGVLNIGNGMVNLSHEDVNNALILAKDGVVTGTAWGGILIKTNVLNASSTSATTDNYAIHIGAKNSTVNAGIYNSVVLGGDSLVADQANTVFAQELRFDSGIQTQAISDRGSDALLTINQYGENDFVLTTDNGTQATSSFELGTEWYYLSAVVNTSPWWIYAGYGFEIYAPDSNPRNGLELSSLSSSNTPFFLAVDNSTYDSYSPGSVNMFPVFLSNRNSIFQTGVVNSVLLGGKDMVGDQSNTAFAQELRFDSSNHNTVISDRSSNTLITFDLNSKNDIVLTTDPNDGDRSDAWIYLDEDEGSIGYNDGSATFKDGEASIIYNATERNSYFQMLDTVTQIVHNSAGFGGQKINTLEMNDSYVRMIFDANTDAWLYSINANGFDFVKNGLSTPISYAGISEPPSTDETALLLRMNKGGSLVYERVELGAADSGGTGFRALVVSN